MTNDELDWAKASGRERQPSKPVKERKVRKEKVKKERKPHPGRAKKVGIVVLVISVVVAACTGGYFLLSQPAEPSEDTGHTATQNITTMIADLTPSFILLVFVLVFMIMLLTIFDGIGRH